MKKIHLIYLFFCLSFSQVYAQSGVTLTQGKPGLVYSLPKSEFCIEVEIEKTTQKPGVFYQYSERYLATNQVILEEKTTYHLKGISVKPLTVPDSSRTYVISPDRFSQLNHLIVNKQGILCGVNTKTNDEQIPIKITEPESKQNIDTSTSGLLPLGEEFMMAGSTAKLAEGAAKQIYRIRESRLSLLTGDLDHLPADGTSFNSMINGMNKAEKELTELFTGKITTEIRKQSIILMADSAINNKILFRLSAFSGFVSTDDLSGAPYYISIKPDKINTVQPGLKEKIEKTGLNTVLPADTKIIITDGLKTCFENRYFIPQLGVILPVSLSIFQKPKVEIHVDEQTGRLLYIK